MSALSDPANLDLTRRPERDGDVRDEPWFQEVTGIAADRPDDEAATEQPNGS